MNDDQNDVELDCTITIKKILDNDGITISSAKVKEKGKDEEIPITVFYNGPSTLGS